MKQFIEYVSHTYTYTKTGIKMPDNVSSGMVSTLSPRGNFNSHLAISDDSIGVGLQFSRYPGKLYEDCSIKFDSNYGVTQCFKQPLIIKSEVIENKELQIVNMDNHRVCGLSIYNALKSDKILISTVNDNNVYIQRFASTSEKYKILEIISSKGTIIMYQNHI
jgi:hypothetical protein